MWWCMKKIMLFLMLLMSLLVETYNELHVSKIVSLSKLGQPINASRCDFRGSGSLLRSLNLSKSNLGGALFNANDTSVVPATGTVKVPGQITDLSYVNFSGALLVSTGFSGVKFEGANFDGADICYADFTGADLRGALNLDKAKNSSLARFCGATMPDGSTFTGKTWQSSAGKTYYSHCPDKSN